MTTIKWWIGIFLLLCVAYIGFDEYQSEIQIEKIRQEHSCQDRLIQTGQLTWPQIQDACRK